MNVTVKLPDGSTRQYAEPVSARKVAENISPPGEGRSGGLD